MTCPRDRCHLMLSVAIVAASAVFSSSACQADVRPDSIQPYRGGEKDHGGRAQGQELRDLADAVRTLQAPEKPGDPRYQQPCRNDGQDARSDLCAQWTAAEAAGGAAFWTKWGFYLSVVGIVGLLVNLFLTVRALRQTREGLAFAAVAVRDGELATRTAMAEFEERMRPRCVVSGMTLLDKWQEHVNAGNPLPLTIVVQNMGGATGRRLAILIERIELLDHLRNSIWSSSQVIELAPLRAGQIRAEGMLLRHEGLDGQVDRIVIKGKIGSRGDELVDGRPALTMVEEFVWTENPLFRGSKDLVEGVPRDEDEAGDYEDHRPRGLPFTPDPGAART